MLRSSIDPCPKPNVLSTADAPDPPLASPLEFNKLFCGTPIVNEDDTPH